MSNENAEKKSSRLSQGEMPRSMLRDVVTLAESLRDNFASKNATPIDLATSINRSPTSSSWRFLTGAAVAYGITDNAYGASSISLTTLGRQIVSPTEEGVGQEGLITALLRPKILKNFYEKYDGSKFPKDDIAKNVLNQLGVPQDRTDEALKIVKENAKLVGIMTDTGNGQYIQLRPSMSVRSLAKNNEAPRQTSKQLEEIATRAGFTPIRVAEGRMVLNIPSGLKDQILEGDNEALHDDWRNLRAELRKFADKHLPDNLPKSESPNSSSLELGEG